MNKTFSFIYFLFVFLGTGACHEGRKYRGAMSNHKLNRMNDTIYLINTSNKELRFYYENKYLDRMQFHLLPHSTYKFFADDRQVIKQTNGNQNFFVFYPGDTLYAKATSSGDAVFTVKNDSIRNNELNLQWEINEFTPLNFMKVLQFRGMYFDNDYKKMDSIYRYDYRTKINFIDQYSKIHFISNNYKIALKNYYKSMLLSSELWLATTSKADIDDSYFIYLNSLDSTIKKSDLKFDKPLFPFLRYQYDKYKLRNLKNKNEYLDSLYNMAKLIENKKLRELALLDITKTELNNNPPYKNFVNDFIKNEGDSDYSIYIKNMRNNNFIMASGGDNNLILNNRNQKFFYDSLINSFKGNIIYIDIWASWCIPCRAEMPFSAALRSKYKNRNIRFVYLSIDSKVNSWKTVNSELGLDNYADSYLLLNAQKTNLFKKFKISSIPRYILLNKNGIISDMNAPRPSDHSIGKVIEKLIRD